MDFGSGELLDDFHGRSTVGTGIKIRSLFGGRSVLLGERFWGRAQQLKTKRQQCSAPTVGQETEVADAHESLRKNVE